LIFRQARRYVTNVRGGVALVTETPALFRMKMGSLASA
jgi:hypothetical protein